MLVSYRDQLISVYQIVNPTSNFSNWLYGESKIPFKDSYDIYSLQCVWVSLSMAYALRGTARIQIILSS